MGSGITSYSELTTMSPMQVRIDDLEIIPGVIKATVTYIEPDTDEMIGSTVEIVLHLKKSRDVREMKDYQRLSEEAVKKAERVLRNKRTSECQRR